MFVTINFDEEKIAREVVEPIIRKRVFSDGPVTLAIYKKIDAALEMANIDKQIKAAIKEKRKNIEKIIDDVVDDRVKKTLWAEMGKWSLKKKLCAAFETWIIAIITERGLLRTGLEKFKMKNKK